jgi:hypothetical protein
MKNALSALDDFCVATIRAAMQYMPAYMAILPKDRLVGAGSFETALFFDNFPAVSRLHHSAAEWRRRRHFRLCDAADAA